MLGIIFAVVVIIIVLALIGFFISSYNGFLKLKNGAESTLAQIKVALKKRLDMISQLVDSVKSYADFEKETLQSVTEMRSRVGQLKDAAEVTQVSNQSRKILDNIIAVMENYPDLKAQKNVEELMSAIKQIEDEIARHRYTYNNIVQDYNTRTDVIPSAFVANMFHFKKLEYLEFEEEISKRPDTKW